MNTRVKIKVRNIPDLLKSLDGDLEQTFTFDLDLELSKTTIQILNNYCEDWDFVDSSKEDKIEKKETVSIEDSGPESYYSSRLKIKTYNDLATLLEAIFKLYKNSPNIKFESGLFYNTLEAEYNKVASEPISVEHSLIAMIIESYYGITNMENAIEDTVEKLKGMWISKELSGHPGVTSLTKILYGGKK